MNQCPECGAARTFRAPGPEVTSVANVRPAEPGKRCGVHLEQQGDQVAHCGAPAVLTADVPGGWKAHACRRHGYVLRRLEREGKRDA